MTQTYCWYNLKEKELIYYNISIYMAASDKFWWKMLSIKIGLLSVYLSLNVCLFGTNISVGW
ncbi:uncharacterized protein PHALS_14849 [Plasmopara halstedii]|uniref:Uncharacterized protein n=1 Tax=Plasmopara halstedii TaxID=4781 RepID=A0A0P1A7Q1_PLAHL|nr:uncharacterized protein PHALS_14849 [Plasmopara halstedii]CEG36303.1 hypothetical protein PHALS_14849 [Plasmopara halstedii]|eukprot:XP_024572672.1 hypothetical protein PHALS_14849 [Plasmopara halstedii]